MRSNSFRLYTALLAVLFAAMCLLLAVPSLLPVAEAANHREAPITALDRTADITDWYTFRSYEAGRENTITMILGVDPLLEPSNGPNYFPFDPEIAYRLIVDNNRDAEDDIIYEFRFTTEIKLPDVFTAFVGNLNFGPIPPITSLDPGDPGSTGINLLQTYTMTVLDVNGNVIAGPFDADVNGNSLVAVPSNVGPKTMPGYGTELAPEGVYTIDPGDGGNPIRVFAGTTDDAFYIDLGGAFDSLNMPVVMLQGRNDRDGIIVGDARDDVSGFNVNTIALEVPIERLTSTGELITDPNDPNAVIGTYGATFRPTTRTFGQPIPRGTALVQIQRMGNPLINELIIGTGFKDSFSMSEPETDGRFANGSSDGTVNDPPDFFLDPLVATLLNTEFGVNVPPAPRTDLLPLVQYIPPICPGCNPAGEGPVADLLRLNVAFPTTNLENRSRLGALTLFIDDNPENDDLAGHPNGRRVFDDVTDIFLRVGAGVLAGPPFNGPPNDRLGDGVNRNDAGFENEHEEELDNLGYQNVFPYVAFANSGFNSRHVDRNEKRVRGQRQQ